jgi:peptidyl-prolyl cis-trans isomerase-like protein 2
MCIVSYQIRYTKYILKDLFDILVVFVWTERSFQFGSFFQSVSIAGEFHCPVLHKVFTEFTHIVAVKTTGNVFCYEAIKELNIKPKNWKELLTDEPFTRDDLITIQDPNALDAKVLSEFDHVKNELQLDDEELKKLREDPAYNINLSDDTKRILQELGTEKGQASALLGGGGDKAQRAHALAVQAAKTRPEVEEGKEAPPPALSIVDAASAAVHGRSAEAAKASTAAKTAARVAAHAAGEIVPVNTKMV